MAKRTVQVISSVDVICSHFSLTSCCAAPSSYAHFTMHTAFQHELVSAVFIPVLTLLNALLNQ